VFDAASILKRLRRCWSRWLSGKSRSAASTEQVNRNRKGVQTLSVNGLFIPHSLAITCLIQRKKTDDQNCQATV
jgi:hypothetical protein